VTIFFENRAVDETMWKNTVDPRRPQMTIWRKRIPCWIPKATNTHSEYVILIAFPLQQRLYERASMLRYMFVACLAPAILPMQYIYSKRDACKVILFFFLNPRVYFHRY
jgi:hypothetical protein